MKDVDESIWEDKGDGTVVRKQPTAGRSQWSTIRKYSMNHEESVFLVYLVNWYPTYILSNDPEFISHIKFPFSLLAVEIAMNNVELQQCSWKRTFTAICIGRIL